jgi:hypothetical protein
VWPLVQFRFKDRSNAFNSLAKAWLVRIEDIRLRHEGGVSSLERTEELIELRIHFRQNLQVCLIRPGEGFEVARPRAFLQPPRLHGFPKLEIIPKDFAQVLSALDVLWDGPALELLVHELRTSAGDGFHSLLLFWIKAEVHLNALPLLIQFTERSHFLICPFLPILESFL